MRFCAGCGAALHPSSAPPPLPQARAAGVRPQIESPPPVPVSHAGYAPPPVPVEIPRSSQGRAATGLAQIFGLDPRIALMAVVLDAMLFTGEIVTAGLFLIVSMLAGIVFGIITYRAQKSWYGDDHDSAMIKGLIMGLLTAIPTSLPAFLYMPAGFVGLIHLMRGKK